MVQTLKPNSNALIDAGTASLQDMITELRSQNERLQEIIVELLIKNQCLRYGIDPSDFKDIQSPRNAAGSSHLPSTPIHSTP